MRWFPCLLHFTGMKTRCRGNTCLSDRVNKAELGCRPESLSLPPLPTAPCLFLLRGLDVGLWRGVLIETLVQQTEFTLTVSVFVQWDRNLNFFMLLFHILIVLWASSHYVRTHISQELWVNVSILLLQHTEHVENKDSHFLICVSPGISAVPWQARNTLRLNE